MTHSPNGAIVESAWQDQALWSATAGQLKTELTAWRRRAAIAGVSGAFLTTLATALRGWGVGWWWLQALVALAGAVALAVVPYVSRTKVSKERIAEWVRARSASEAFKELIYRYLLRARPFGPAAGPADLTTQCQAVKAKVQNLLVYTASVRPPTKSRPLSLSLDEYVEQRVNAEIDSYYRPRAAEKAQAARLLRGLEFWLGLIAVVLGAAAGATVGVAQLALIGVWTPVATTAGAAVTAHLAASRYEHDTIIYLGTADRLATLRDELRSEPGPPSPECIAVFVDACEHAISTENESWLAGWTEDQSGKAPGGRAA